MKLIQPNCRAQFTVEDMDFLVSVLAASDGDLSALTKLFSDPEAMDVILDDERLFRALLERPDCLKVSRHFYFYVLVRHVLRRSGLEDRGLADYVAEMLAEFAIEEARRALDAEGRPMDYLVEMLAALEKADDRTRFLIRAHIGNHSLFFSGVFPDRVRHRAQYRGAPELAYYESLGSASYRVAGDHQLAQRMELSPIFVKLAEGFHSIRLALNAMSDRLVSLGDGDDYALENILRATPP